MPPARSDGPGRTGAALTAEEFAVRFQAAARVLWTVAAGVLGSPSEAEDVLQEACVMALGKLDRYRHDTSFNAWMASFVRNVALNHARKTRRRATRPTDPEALGGVTGGGEAGRAGRLPVDGKGELRADQAAFDDRVIAGLRLLPGTQRASLLLRTVLDLSYREIAETLAIPLGTAMSHVHRARETLRERLAAEEPDGAVRVEERA